MSFLPPVAIARILVFDAPDVGLISSPPRAVAAEGVEALVECAILNSYQDRWQSCADAAGYGFAQGKVLAFRRGMVERAGGLRVLGREPAEDAAATKLVRSLGLRVRVIDRFSISLSAAGPGGTCGSVRRAGRACAGRVFLSSLPKKSGRFPGSQQSSPPLPPTRCRARWLEQELRSRPGMGRGDLRADCGMA